jgi:hypothetical protein
VGAPPPPPAALTAIAVYANSLMATLNVRPSLAKAAVQIDTSIELPPRGAPTSSQEAWRVHKAVTSSVRLPLECTMTQQH